MIGYNRGKVHNSYTIGDIQVSGIHSNSLIGGFVGYNELLSGHSAMINKCFSMSDMTIDSAPASYGYFVGRTTGTEKYCYYLDTAACNRKVVVDGVENLEPLTPNTSVGEAKSMSDILSSDFILNTLNFDKMEWFIVDGELPKLR